MKKWIWILALLLVLVIPVCAAGEPVSDEADILTAEEIEQLTDSLEKLQDEYGLEVVIVTVEDTDGENVEDYTEAFYEDGNYSDDCIILLISMEQDWCIFGNGEGGDIFTESVIEDVGNKIRPELSAGNFADAFDVFIDQCRYYIEESREFDVVGALIGSLILGLIVAFIATFVMRRKLKSVRRKDAAADYLKPGSMVVTAATELYLYSNVRRIKKQQNSSGGSNRSRSIGSGKF